MSELHFILRSIEIAQHRATNGTDEATLALAGKAVVSREAEDVYALIQKAYEDYHIDVMQFMELAKSENFVYYIAAFTMRAAREALRKSIGAIIEERLTKVIAAESNGLDAAIAAIASGKNVDNVAEFAPYVALASESAAEMYTLASIIEALGLQENLTALLGIQLPADNTQA